MVSQIFETLKMIYRMGRVDGVDDNQKFPLIFFTMSGKNYIAVVEIYSGWSTDFQNHVS